MHRYMRMGLNRWKYLPDLPPRVINPGTMRIDQYNRHRKRLKAARRKLYVRYDKNRRVRMKPVYIGFDLGLEVNAFNTVVSLEN